MRILEVITERKSADLYHSTHSDETFLNILKSGFIKPNFDSEHITEKDPRPYISLSRDKRFDMFGSLPITFVIDQNKLTSSHKITPYDSFAGDDDYLQKSSGNSEAEERVYKPIPISYIKHIIIRDADFIDIDAVIDAAKKYKLPVVDLKGNRLDENFAEDKEIGIHRSSEDFAVIDLSKSADGTFWLNGVDNTDWDSTVTTGQGVDMAFEISPQARLASYDDIDKYSVDELKNMGYDGVRMKDGDNVAYQIWNTKILKRTKLGENFADGKNPGRKGLSQRVGIPKNATIAQLEKAAKAGGEKGRMARWQLNMRRGRKKGK